MIARDATPRPASPSRGTGRITLAHGGGGQLTDELVRDTILPRLGNDALNELLDAAIVAAGTDRLALTVDGYVVQPLKFPGGDIGRLAVCGTVNDLAVTGATPKAIALGLILAEGFEQSVLEDVLDSVADAAREAEVRVITGDIKVVGRGQADGMYITTAGIGHVESNCRLHPSRVEPGQALIINGPIADHGLAVLLARDMPDVESVLRSDVAPLNGLIRGVLAAAGDAVSFMRDPTRGGLAGLCSDLAARTGWRVSLDERAIPIRTETQYAAELLGIDPLEVANEGKVVVVLAAAACDAVLAAMHAHPLGRDARVIGHIDHARDGICEMITSLGGRRIVQKPYGEQLPRIC
jgi:hydrogenase expression/formation protein HypE